MTWQRVQEDLNYLRDIATSKQAITGSHTCMYDIGDNRDRDQHMDVVNWEWQTFAVCIRVFVVAWEIHEVHYYHRISWNTATTLVIVYAGVLCQ